MLSRQSQDDQTSKVKDQGHKVTRGFRSKNAATVNRINLKLTVEYLSAIPHQWPPLI